MFNRAEWFEQLWWTVTQGIFLYNNFKIHLLVKAEKSFRGFTIFSSSGHFVQWRRTVQAILVEGHPKNIPVKLF